MQRPACASLMTIWSSLPWIIRGKSCGKVAYFNCHLNYLVKLPQFLVNIIQKELLTHMKALVIRGLALMDSLRGHSIGKDSLFSGK